MFATEKTAFEKDLEDDLQSILVAVLQIIGSFPRGPDLPFNQRFPVYGLVYIWKLGERS